MKLFETAIKENIETEEQNKNNFLQDVIAGLRQHPKHLQSKYFYDQRGDTLFQEIMNLPEYYLTRCEMDIFENKTAEIAAGINADQTPFDLIELGAGDASKSMHLLRYLKNELTDFRYMPIDISGNILSVLDEKLKKNIPGLDILCLEGEYFDMLHKAAQLSSRRKVILFLGSNIGNMELEEAYRFCFELRKNLNKGDIVMIGFDLKKEPNTILNAYNDAKGVTASFNLNLLERINKELKADFKVDKFEHYETYDPLSGACRSYLISLEDQKVSIDDAVFHFAENEAVYMEVSQKFSTEDTEKMAAQSGFTQVYSIKDSKEWFVDAFWKAV
ncbi:MULTISPECIES: L-histidine N(alpha)-methyltransferase [unclassified Flavobacterium]|uniref:L-histidine N(alpha)-methyltransferase n=1 Tax=unclassified Flavobacterium TaxID=196869 RepID=UPI001066EDCE|nr:MULTISPECIES: L-histidine N(alpha)-methyltransferase [unclassified Flavobacterium]TDX08387.1 dimethylhistidine N-methyltransferase [Flavobacterium sp. S87F.05.LMB.W.Kidney.N]BDU26608.1 dimethylhistidine N-methyltransferase [Flavobacterium sp. GSB-24]